jgi:hypothetical protein
MSEKSSWLEWCSANETSVMPAYQVRWQPGQPDNFGGNQKCIHLKIATSVWKAEITDRNCTAKFPFACQVIHNGITLHQITEVHLHNL